MNSYISLMAFYLIQKKNFRYWQIKPNGPKRTDSLVFLSHVLKIQIYRNLGIEFQYNFERNYTNLKSYRYKMSSISVGFYLNQ